ncbi:MAG: hypothetical protein ACRD41_09415, partial [Candidatus Acidiferrales bacterium]
SHLSVYRQTLILGEVWPEVNDHAAAGDGGYRRGRKCGGKLRERAPPVASPARNFRAGEHAAR